MSNASRATYQKEYTTALNYYQNILENHKEGIYIDEALFLSAEIYKNQNNWSVGNKIEEVNKKLFLIANKFNLSNEKLSSCLQDQKLEDKILNDRIDGQKKYSINSTPTIIINEKKFEGNLTFDNLSKEISKKLK